MPGNKFFGKRNKIKSSNKVFNKKGPGNKRKKFKNDEKIVKKAKTENREKVDEIISSEDDEGDVCAQEKQDDFFYASEEETEQEKKIRLTKKYLDQIKNEENEKNDGSTVSKDAIADRLRDEALEEAGRLQKKKAHEYENKNSEPFLTLKGHRLSITCLAISSDEKYVYSGSKDCSVIKWSAETGKKVKVISGGKKGTESTHIGHTAHVLAIALTSDDTFLATGCRNGFINIWKPDSMELLKALKGHKGAITGLTFQRGSHQLMTVSSDRSLKLWNVDEMGYIETLFGHQDGVTGIDSFFGETAVTSGGRDNTVRIWKIVQESQLVFQGHGPSIDCICATGPQHFVSGSDDGTLCLWGVNKKKPLSKSFQVHGSNPETDEPYWITSICALHNTDLLASGSQNGYIKLWRRDDEKRVLQPVMYILAKGFVNAMCFSPSGKYLVAGLGQEHKLGRWWQIKDAKNVIVIYHWPDKL